MCVVPLVAEIHLGEQLRRVTREGSSVGVSSARGTGKDVQLAGPVWDLLEDQCPGMMLGEEAWKEVQGPGDRQVPDIKSTR